ncbi:unnamed protein product [Lampetra fluviatilis]
MPLAYRSALLALAGAAYSGVYLEALDSLVMEKMIPVPDTRRLTDGTVYRRTEDDGKAFIFFFSFVFFSEGAAPIRPFTYHPGSPQEAHSCPAWGPSNEDLL